MIYFMQPSDGGPVKIGHSADVEARRQQLESYYGQCLAVLATMPGGRAEEARLHERFGHLRIGRTEQFQPAPDLMQFIGRPLLVSADPEAVEPMETVCRRTVLTIKGTDEWREWLDGFGKHLRTPTSTIVDHALVRYAKETGYAPEAPER